MDYSNCFMLQSILVRSIAARETAMSSILHFSPAFKPSLSLSNSPGSPRHLSNKRKRGVQTLDSDGEGCWKADFAANATGLPSRQSKGFVTTLAAAPSVDISYGDITLHSQTPSDTDHEGLPASDFPRSFPHHLPETAPSMSQGRISDKLATLKPPLYVATGRVPTATARKTPSSTGLRQHHLNAITAIMHKCLSDGDYFRAGRAWAMLLRAEQIGHSMDLRTHDRWGVGAEILLRCESQMAQKTLDHRAFGLSRSTSNLRVKAESMEKAKEYYERIVLQYPYRKVFPNATGPLNFSIAMFSLWIYTIKERSSIALMAVGSSDEDIDETDQEANNDSQWSSASDVELDRYQKREQVKRDTLQSAHEIATRLDGLLVSPPYSDNARFWKLCGELALWIADLSVATIFSNSGSSPSGDYEDLTVGRSSRLRHFSRSTTSNEEQAGQERQKALAKAKEAFQRVKICGESPAE